MFVNLMEENFIKMNQVIHATANVSKIIMGMISYLKKYVLKVVQKDLFLIKMAFVQILHALNIFI